MIGNNQALNALRVGYADKRKYICSPRDGHGTSFSCTPAINQVSHANVPGYKIRIDVTRSCENNNYYYSNITWPA